MQCLSRGMARLPIPRPRVNYAKRPMATAHAPAVDKVAQKVVRAPRTVDFNIIGACNLNCTWCWGPDHKAKEELTIAQWKDIASKLRKLGTEKITFTGGETLMKEGLADLLNFVHEKLGIRTTLSTNGILMKRLGKSVLPFVDDIGLPLDGHTQEVNNRMREGTPKHFERVLHAIKLVQDDFPKVDITVRTVLSAKNLDSVPFIGQTMLDAGINPAKLRWKIYQVSPMGIRKEAILKGDWLITADQFQAAVAKVRTLNLKFNIDTLGIEKHVGRYFHIYPDGKSHVFVTGKDGYPVALPVGNIGKRFDEVIAQVADYDLDNNQIR